MALSFISLGVWPENQNLCAFEVCPIFCVKYYVIFYNDSLSLFLKKNTFPSSEKKIVKMWVTHYFRLKDEASQYSPQTTRWSLRGWACLALCVGGGSASYMWGFGTDIDRRDRLLLITIQGASALCEKLSGRVLATCQSYRNFEYVRLLNSQHGSSPGLGTVLCLHWRSEGIDWCISVSEI